MTAEMGVGRISRRDRNKFIDTCALEGVLIILSGRPESFKYQSYLPGTNAG